MLWRRCCVTWCRWSWVSVSTCRLWRPWRSQSTATSPSFTRSDLASRRVVACSSSAACGRPRSRSRCRWLSTRTTSSPTTTALWYARRALTYSQTPSSVRTHPVSLLWYARAVKTGHVRTQGASSQSEGRWSVAIMHFRRPTYLDFVPVALITTAEKR